MVVKRKNEDGEVQSKNKQAKTASDTVSTPSTINDEEAPHGVTHSTIAGANAPDQQSDSAVDNYAQMSDKWRANSEVANGRAEEYPSVKLEGFEPPLLTRLMTMRKYSDRTRGFYYVTTMPETLRFGHDQAFDMSNFVVRGDNYPVHIWVIGRITALNFVKDDGSWPDQVYMSIHPLVKDDTRAATRITNLYSRPRQWSDLNPWGTIIANHFQKVYNSDKPAKEFTSIYDARKEMKPKKAMKQLPASTLKKGDLVCAEMRVKKRFDKKDDDIPKKDRPHTISFQLQSVFYLEEGVEPTDDDKDVCYDF
ncbi:hypothetical protein CALCODRAFT_511253 [Calocera cornea HHB12733]|uniref:Uncharacterized protein n=1 Tax=Calocera cornea HHB12733 TaxID=1353952 RepID=A0A165DWQ0_9BASI|nr:hypothetical protein CALCODRAFT_511253 [Calocera cornea HHB12733]